MYDELVKRIHEQAVDLPEKFSKNAELLDVLMKAADAIEELTGFVQEAERDRDEYRERLDKANDAIEEMQKRCEQFQYMPPPAWIPVTERLPEEIGNYLVAINCPRGKWVEICACDGRDWVSVDEYAEYATKWVTHWMPLPTPPTAEEDER